MSIGFLVGAVFKLSDTYSRSNLLIASYPIEPTEPKTE